MSHIVAAPSQGQFLQAGTAALPRADTKFDYSSHLGFYAWPRATKALTAVTRTLGN